MHFDKQPINDRAAAALEAIDGANDAERAMLRDYDLALLAIKKFNASRAAFVFYHGRAVDTLTANAAASLELAESHQADTPLAPLPDPSEPTPPAAEGGVASDVSVTVGVKVHGLETLEELESRLDAVAARMRRNTQAA